MTPLLWVHIIAAATALALAEHWLRYVLVERKRHRRAVDRLARIERHRDWKRRQEMANLRARASSPEGRAAWIANVAAQRAELARQQQGIIDDYNLDAAARGAAPWPSGLGLGQAGMQTGTGPYDLWVADRMGPRRK
jgi:hypothetical protein